MGDSSSHCPPLLVYLVYGYNMPCNVFNSYWIFHSKVMILAFHLCFISSLSCARGMIAKWTLPFFEHFICAVFRATLATLSKLGIISNFCCLLHRPNVFPDVDLYTCRIGTVSLISSLGPPVTSSEEAITSTFVKSKLSPESEAAEDSGTPPCHLLELGLMWSIQHSDDVALTFSLPFPALVLFIRDLHGFEVPTRVAYGYRSHLGYPWPMPCTHPQAGSQGNYLLI